jgi:EAL and modified HD-GYP domain-containing signal transduction protein
MEQTTEVFVARHPIFDRYKNVYGYELVFRSGFEAQYGQIEADRSAVDFLAFVDFEELADGKKGFVNFSRDLLLTELPAQLPRETMIVGIPAELTGDADLVRTCLSMKDVGYMLALTGLTPEHIDNPMLKVVDIAKVDFTLFDAEQQKTLCQKLTAHGVSPLAEGLDEIEQFEQACEWGCSFFEGEFFSKPDDRVENKIPGNEMAHLRVLHCASQSEVNYDELAELIEQDVAMTYMLLRFMNSAWFGLRYEIRSVKHALVMLGPQEIRRWVSLFVVRMTGKDKPFELLLRSLTRARGAEMIGLMVEMNEQSSELFLMGMFSVIDALMDMSMDKILCDLPLGEDIKDALLGVQNDHRRVFDLILAYERGEWERFSHFSTALNVDERLVPDVFRKSLQWAHQALEGL